MNYRYTKRKHAQFSDLLAEAQPKPIKDKLLTLSAITDLEQNTILHYCRTSVARLHVQIRMV